MSSLVGGDRNKPKEKKGNDTPEGSARGLNDWREWRRHLSHRVWRRQRISETQKCNGNGGSEIQEDPRSKELKVKG